MSPRLQGKRVAVLSDSEMLFKAIEVNLNSRLKVNIVRPVSDLVVRPDAEARIDEFDLIVVAISQSGSEPVVALSRASLARLISQVPLLIISEKPFESDPSDNIVHLDFPFKPNVLRDQVRKLLQDEPAIREESRSSFRDGSFHS
jgi:hypothetical protein